MVWKKEPFGKTSQGSAATLYTIENKKGMALKVTDLGAAIVEIIVPDRDGVKRDVVLGYEDAKGYEDGTYFFGACVGRNANRTGGASIEINGEIYCLDKNDGENNLHSGWNFYYQRVFRLSKIEDNSITFVLESPHMDQGFPGRVDIYVTYTLSEENEVKITYHAVPDQDTIINLTNHSYFNLNGHDSKEVLAQKVWISTAVAVAGTRTVTAAESATVRTTVTAAADAAVRRAVTTAEEDRKSTRLNSSH